MALCFSMEQNFDSLHPDDQEQLQSILEKDCATRWSSSLPVVELKQQRQCPEAYMVLLCAGLLMLIGYYR